MRRLDLLPMAVGQLTHPVLTPRYRGQAPSHIGRISMPWFSFGRRSVEGSIECMTPLKEKPRNVGGAVRRFDLLPMVPGQLIYLLLTPHCRGQAVMSVGASLLAKNANDNAGS